MKNSKDLFNEIVKRISINESHEEIQSLVYITLEHVLSVSKTDIISEKSIPVSEHQQNQLTEIVHRINTHEPIQYILGETEFYGRKFKVNNAVLIPRPETEELIPIIKQYGITKLKSLHILDIGTGSGCIPITLFLEMKTKSVIATDISEMALNTARENAKSHQTSVNFIKHDILREELPFITLDIVVSNPPYVTENEKASMSKNVLEHEPHTALFVPDINPLLFYSTIASKAVNALEKGGLLIMEINEKYGNEVAGVFEKSGFKNIQIVKDLSGKNRIVHGLKIS